MKLFTVFLIFLFLFLTYDSYMILCFFVVRPELVYEPVVCISYTDAKSKKL